MIGRSALYKLLILLFSCNFIYAQNYSDKSVDSLLLQGIEKLISQEYNESSRIFNDLDKLRPEIPLGKIYLAGVEISRAFDLGLQYPYDHVDSLLTESSRIVKQLLKKDDGNIWFIYFAGLTQGFKAYFSALNGEYLNAFMDGYKALKYFDDCLILNEDFVEAKVAIGTYLYWRSAKTDGLNWLPFFSDEKSAGINLLEEASTKARYNKYMAAYSLIWIYINEERYDEAIKIGEKYLIKYPQSRLFKLSVAKAYKFTDKLKSISIYKEVLKSYKSLPNNNYFQEIMLNYQIAQLYFDIKEYKKTAAHCESILSLKNLSPFVLNKLGDRLKKIEELRNEALHFGSNN